MSKIIYQKMKKDIEALGFKTRIANKDELYPDEATYFKFILMKKIGIPQ